MSDHVIGVSTIGTVEGFSVTCSCGEFLLSENLADLGYLNEIAHEHIEAAERGYRTDPLITTEGELIDLETGEPRG